MNNEVKDLDPNSPFTLFLILVLLVLGQSRNLEDAIERTHAYVLATKRSIEGIRGGLHAMNTSMETFQANFLDLHKK